MPGNLFQEIESQYKCESVKSDRISQSFYRLHDTSLAPGVIFQYHIKHYV